MKIQVNSKMMKSEVKNDIEQKTQAYEQVKHADFDDVLSLLNTAHGMTLKKTFNVTLQFTYKQAGYEDYYGKYDIWSMGEEYGSFLIWDENSNKLLKDPENFWLGLFIDDPYIKVTHSQHPNIGTIPDIPIASNRIINQYLKPDEQQEAYRQFREGLGLDSCSNIQAISYLETYNDLLMRKTGYLVDEMKSLDMLAKQVLMVYYYEVAKQIKSKSKNKAEFVHGRSALDSTINQSYNVMFLKYSHSNTNFRSLLNRDGLKPFINQKILDSAVNGMTYLVDQKEPYVITLIGYYEKLSYVEQAINEILHGVTDHKVIQPNQSYNEKVIRFALEMNPQTRQYEVELFWQKYAELRHKYPGWVTGGKPKYSKFTRQILESYPGEITVSDVTLNDWIKKYEIALKCFNEMFIK